MNPALTIYTAAASVLRDRGERESQRRVSRLFGMPDTGLSQYLAGKQPRLETVAGWLDAWAANEYPPLSFGMGKDSCWCGLASAVELPPEAD